MNFFILLALAIILGYIVCMVIAEKRPKKTLIMYGYPPYGKVWLSIYHRRKTDEWIFEWDDLFDEGRPKSWGHISEDFMFSENGATQEEVDTARKKLKKRGYYL